MDSQLRATTEWLELMRSGGCVAVFWEGHYAGIGWLLFEDAGELESWLRWQVAPEVLGDEETWGDSYKELRALEERLSRLEALPDRITAGSVYLDGVRAWLHELEALLDGSTLGASHLVCNFDELMTDARLAAAFRGSLEDNGPTLTSPKEDLSAFEAFLVGRYDTPTVWREADQGDG